MSSAIKFLKEPLLHFLLIGCMIFVVFEIADDSPPAAEADLIVITEADATRLSENFKKAWRRRPNGDELAALIEDRVREEVFVREALALGLDQDDAVVRRRLRQKMEFLTASVVEAMEPTEDELLAFFKSQAGQFERAAQMAFEQVFLGENPSESEIALSLGKLRSSADPTEIGVRSLIPSGVPLSPAVAVDGTFGRGFFERLAAFSPGEWAGPVRSGYGIHLVRIAEIREPALPPFKSVREKVLQAWRTATQKKLLDRQYDQLRSRYDVSLPSMEPAGQASQ
jgi:hypothetical protein